MEQLWWEIVHIPFARHTAILGVSIFVILIGFIFLQIHGINEESKSKKRFVENYIKKKHLWKN